MRVLLAVVSAGHHRRSEIAGALGRANSALAHLPYRLQGIGLLEQVEDAVRDRRGVFRIAEPVVRLHRMLMQRHEPEPVVGRADRVWDENADTVAGKIHGPHFEELARQWCFEHAALESFGVPTHHVECVATPEPADKGA
nr:hypothetical protein StreXyl84_11740 [Streptomyces sp. Xyl84]